MFCTKKFGRAIPKRLMITRALSSVKPPSGSNTSKTATKTATSNLFGLGIGGAIGVACAFTYFKYEPALIAAVKDFKDSTTKDTEKQSSKSSSSSSVLKDTKLNHHHSERGRRKSERDWVRKMSGR